MTLLHAHERKGGEEEGEKERKTVGVVKTGEQHHEEQRREGHAAAGRQDVEPPPRKAHRQLIEPLALAHPGGQARAQGACEGREGVPTPGLPGCGAREHR